MPDPERAHSSEPIDPLTPRPDDPWIGRWWWARRLYRRERDRPLFFRWPVAVTLMVIVLSLVAIVVVRLVRAE